MTGIVIHGDLPEIGRLDMGSYVAQHLWQSGLGEPAVWIGRYSADCPQWDKRLDWLGNAQQPDGTFRDIASDTERKGMSQRGSSPSPADAGVILPCPALLNPGGRGRPELIDAGLSDAGRCVMHSGPGLHRITVRQPRPVAAERI